MTTHTYTFEVTDSDGYDSTQEIRAQSLQKARAIAYEAHGTQLHRYDPEAWPCMWASLTYTTDRTAKVTV